MKKDRKTEKPTPEDFGWQAAEGGVDSEPSGWYEGGEEAYRKALEEWEAS